MALSLREHSSVEDLPRDAWNQLVREAGASIFFEHHLLAAVFHHSVEHPLAIRYFTIWDADRLVGGAAAYAIRHSVWWAYYEELVAIPDLFRGPWIAMPSVITWSGDPPLAAGTDAGEAAALLVAAGRRFAAAHQAVALAITDVTRDAPLTAPLAALADLPIFLDNNAVIAVHAEFDAYLASLDKFVRRELQRVRRRAEEAGCQWRSYRSTGNPADYPSGLLDRLLILANGGAIRHDHDPEYTLGLLTALACAPSAQIFVAAVGDDVVSFFLVHDDGPTFYVQAGGWDAARKELSPFVTLVYEVVQKAHDQRKQTIEFGRTNYRFKRKHGAHFVPLYGLFYLTDNADAELADRIRSLEQGLRNIVGADGGDVTALL